ncbi:MAG: Gfo/Idh/MocA family oxidoreductase, partial [Deferribacteraceae bacterium]|nr:Gfo/Idh/MocA family oxidoreductase [Deferribacteraceae bacterium]
NSFEELLASDIDTVYIATQNDSHFTYSQKALLANKNVLCEKPACVNYTQLSEILDLANKKGLKFMEAMRFLHIPAYVELKKRLKSKAYGNIISIEGSLGKISQRTYRHTKDLCGGATMDLSIYPATAVIDLLGYPDHIASGCIKNDAEVDSSMSAIFSYNSGIIGNVHASFTTLTRGELRICTDQCTLTLPKQFTTTNEIIIEQPDGKLERIPCELSGTGMAFELEYFCKSANNALNHELSLNVVKALDAVRKQQGIVFAAD